MTRASRQDAEMVTPCQPVAPFGAGGRCTLVCTSPSALTARTCTSCCPATAVHRYTHCRQVSAGLFRAAGFTAELARDDEVDGTCVVATLPG